MGARGRAARHGIRARPVPAAAPAVLRAASSASPAPHARPPDPPRPLRAALANDWRGCDHRHVGGRRVADGELRPWHDAAAADPAKPGRPPAWPHLAGFAPTFSART